MAYPIQSMADGRVRMSDGTIQEAPNTFSSGTPISNINPQPFPQAYPSVFPQVGGFSAQPQAQGPMSVAPQPQEQAFEQQPTAQPTEQQPTQEGEVPLIIQQATSDLMAGMPINELEKYYPQLKGTDTTVFKQLSYDVQGGATQDQIMQAYPELFAQQPQQVSTEQVQGVPQPKEEQSFLGGAFEKTKGSFMGGLERIQKAGEDVAMGEKTFAEGAIRGAAGALETFFSPISGIVGQTAQEGFEELSPETQKQIIDTAKTAYGEGKKVWDELDPETQRFLGNVGVTAEVLANFVGAGAATKAAQGAKAGATGVTGAVQGAVQGAKGAVGSQAGKIAGIPGAIERAGERLLEGVQQAGVQGVGGLRKAERSLRIDVETGLPIMEDIGVSAAIGAEKAAAPGVTRTGEIIDIPERTDTLTEKAAQWYRGDYKKATVPDAFGNTELTRLASTAIKPTSMGKSEKALLVTPKKAEEGLEKIWELQRTGKIEGDLDTMPSAVRTMVDAMDKYGKQIGDAIDEIGGGTIDFGETYGKIARAVNTNLKTLKGQEGYSQLVNLLDDIAKPRTFAEGFELKKIIGAELAGLRNGGKAGTPVYKAFTDFVEDVTTKIDSEVLKRSMSLPELQEAREIYSKLKNISLPFAKSMVVDQRKAPIGWGEQLALIQNFNPIEWVTSPGASAKALAGQKVAQFAKAVNEVNTREGAMKQFFRFQDDMAMARQRGELKDLRPREVKVPKQEKTPLMLEAPKPGAKNRMLSTRKPNVVTQTPEVIYQGKAKPEITERSKIVNPQTKAENISKKNEIPKAETTPVKKAVTKPDVVKPAVAAKPEAIGKPSDYKSIDEFIDSYGKPVYHGTNSQFDKFDISKIGSQTDEGIWGRGFYFAPNKEMARIAPGGNGAKYIKEVYIDRSKLFDISSYKDIQKLADDLDMFEGNFRKQPDGIIRPLYSQIRQFTSHVEDMGYDGVYVNRGGKGDELVIFNPDNIRSKEDIIADWNKSNSVKEATKETPTQKFEEKPTEGMTEKERIQYELDKKQAEREFKDVSERVSGSRKEKAQYAKLSMEQYQKVESESAALANDLVTKDRVLATKFEPKVAREAGEDAGLASYKDKLLSAIAKKPDMGKDFREAYVKDMPEMYRRIAEAKSFDDIKAISDEFTVMRSYRGPESVLFKEDGKYMPEKVFGKRFLDLLTERTDSAKSLRNESVLRSRYTTEMRTAERTAVETRAKEMQNSMNEKISSTNWSEEAKKMLPYNQNFFSYKLARKLTNADVRNPSEQLLKDAGEVMKRAQQTKADYVVESKLKAFDEDPTKAIRSEDWSYLDPKAKQTVEKADTGKPKIHGGSKLDEIVRTGGREVADSEVSSPENIVKDFGYKSVQFGNYMKDADSKASVKRFVESMKDLEDATGIDIKSLNSKEGLSIAFGARGQGGNAAAHYEPYYNIINLTKSKGNGTVAHEFGHFLDFMAGKSYGLKEDSFNKALSTHTFSPNSEGLEKATKELMDTIKGAGQSHERDVVVKPLAGTSYYPSVKTKYAESGYGATLEFIQNRSMREKDKIKMLKYLARLEGGPITVKMNVPGSRFFEDAKELGEYWKRDVELLARSFEGFIQDTLEQKGVRSNYLVSDAVAFPHVNRKQVYHTHPQGVERARINKAFEKWIEEFKKRTKTEKNAGPQ